MIIIDENVDQVLIDRLESENFDLLSIREHYQGISDKEIIEIAKTRKGFILTEDEDFGELVFSYNIKNCTVILLRYYIRDHDGIANNLLKVLRDYYKRPGHFFITITKKKIRIKKL